MSLCVLDFETVDPYLSLGLGPGWCYEYHLKQGKFKVIGWSICHIEEHIIAPSQYVIPYHDSISKLFDLVDHCEALIMHNAPYDLGCLIQLGYPMEKLKKKVIYDTKIMAKLYNNQLLTYSLDELSKAWLPANLQKKKGALIEIVTKHELLKTKTGKTVKPNTNKKYTDAANKYAYTHMDILQEKEPEAMAYYANQDTVATAHLFNLLRSKLKNDELAAYYSYLTFICNVAIRIKGVRVHIPSIHKAIAVLEPVIKQKAAYILDKLKLPHDFNLESPDLADAVDKAGYPLPSTAGGKPSLTSKWIESYEGSDELLMSIKEYRAVNKLQRDFAMTILENLQHTCPDALKGQDWGYVYPELNVLQAKTGRMSSSSPNIQQIPNPENSEYAKLIRSIYIPDEGKQWVACDWSNQEGRWQIHYGRNYGAQELQERFNKDPNMDLHSIIAQMLFNYDKDNVDPALHKKRRKICKGINLGLSYGMGNAKLATSLKVTESEAMELRDKYNTIIPYLVKLGLAITNKLKTNGYIKFFDGRVFRREFAVMNGKTIYFDYKGINALMQGSGASQVYAALYKAYHAGLDILFPVHDEIDIQVTNDEQGEKDIQTLKAIMEDTKSIKCTVPMIAEPKRGLNWGDVK